MVSGRGAWPRPLLQPVVGVALAAVVVAVFVDPVRRLVADRPQALQRVELAHPRQHDVGDHVAKVDQHPFGLALAFHAQRHHVEFLGELDHFVGNRLDVARGGAGGDHHEIGDAALAAHVDLDGILGLQFGDGVAHGLEQLVDGRRRAR